MTSPTPKAAITEDGPEARAVCEHFYASHCYRGMSIRLCMTCGEPDWDDLAEQLGKADAVALPAPVTDFGPVRLELMGHRYREGRLSEVVIAGQPFLRLDLAGGSIEYYRPDAVYCITPGMTPPPRAELPASLNRVLDDDELDDEGGSW